MKNIKFILKMLGCTAFVFSSLTFSFLANAKSYGAEICHKPGFECHRVHRGESWSTLFPDESERSVVRKLNRSNLPLRAGMIIAIPHNVEHTTLLEVSPFPLKRPASSTNVVKVDLSKLAWGAYNKSGDLVRWGPVSGGRNYCPDIGRGCRTVTGTFTFYDSQGANCRSSVYPRPHGGAPMPYCMHFFKGYALHGSNSVPGSNASHGCVRLFTEDAKWLNHEFVRPGYTKVIIQR